METAARYETFADREARDVSALYEDFALGVAHDDDMLAFLATLPPAKRQPNLLFATVKYLAGVLPDYVAFRTYVVGHEDDLRNEMSVRSTQTNEPGRCAVLLPLFAASPQPIALLEVGAAAGLCLLPDRYGYDYGGHRVGTADSPVTFPCEPRGSVPVPEDVPRSCGGWVWTSNHLISPIRTRPDGLRLWCGRVMASAKRGCEQRFTSHR